MNLTELIRTIPDYPKPGIMFRDITTLLGHPAGFKTMIDTLTQRYKELSIDCVAGIEARGFIVGAPLAASLGVGFLPVRKKDKLPAKTVSQTYELEYGVDEIEIHADALSAGSKVLLVDDLIATGGTAEAAVKLIEGVGGQVVECCFVIDLPDLGGSRKLEGLGKRVHSMVQFEGE